MVFWWSPVLAGFRDNCRGARRRIQSANRSRNEARRALALLEYRKEREILYGEMLRTKKRCWKELCNKVEEDV